MKLQPAAAGGPGLASPGRQQRLAASSDAACLAALEGQAAVAAQREVTAALGGQAVLAAAYCRRLQRLATLLQQYDSHLQQALATLGLAPGSCEEGPAFAAAGELAAQLQHIELQLAALALAGDGTSEPLTPEALLLMGDGTPPASSLAAAGAPAVLAALQEGVLADVAAVNAWPDLPPPGSSPADTCAGALSPAFAQLQREQRARWEAAAQRGRQLQQLRGEVAAAREALAASSSSGPPSGGGVPGGPDAAQCRTQLAAQQAGLRAELYHLERSARSSQEQGMAAAARASEVGSLVAGVACLEVEEAQVDCAVRALCAADSQVMRQWRQGTWRAQELVEGGIAAQCQPLVQLSRQLLEAQRAELAAFRGTAAAKAAGLAAAELPQQQQQQHAVAAATAAGATRAAAVLLDPLADLKSDEHAAKVLAAAAAQLAQLQPVRQQWEALAASSAGQMEELGRTAGELGAGVRALQEDGAAGAMAQLREAACAAEEGGALVRGTRQALSEWWTTPAVTAAPWVKREGKSAEEWLRVLTDQQRLLRQRENFTGKDHSNTRQR